jgi:hypothetical protein
MTFQTLGSGCGQPTAGLCYNFRGVVVTGLVAGDGIWANMYSWLNNFDLTTVPWGYLQTNAVSDPSLTAPDNSSSGGMPVNSSNPGPAGFSQWFVIDNNGDPFAQPTGQRCQVAWPAGSPYGVYAIDSWNALQTALICCTGTTGACGANVIDIPLPNSSLPGPIPWNRCHYIAQLGLTPANIQSTYVKNLAFGVAANYGANWNVNQVCYPTQFPSPDDPFDNDIP